MMADDTPNDDSDVGVALDTRPKTKRPPMYKVMILNDDKKNRRLPYGSTFVFGRG